MPRGASVGPEKRRGPDKPPATGNQSTAVCSRCRSFGCGDGGRERRNLGYETKARRQFHKTGDHCASSHLTIPQWGPAHEVGRVVRLGHSDNEHFLLQRKGRGEQIFERVVVGTVHDIRVRNACGQKRRRGVGGVVLRAPAGSA